VPRTQESAIVKKAKRKTILARGFSLGEEMVMCLSVVVGYYGAMRPDAPETQHRA
jgi:hypothetical protein